jgi:hypothetical protein
MELSLIFIRLMTGKWSIFPPKNMLKWFTLFMFLTSTSRTNFTCYLSSDMYWYFPNTKQIANHSAATFGGYHLICLGILSLRCNGNRSSLYDCVVFLALNEVILTCHCFIYSFFRYLTTLSVDRPYSVEWTDDRSVTILNGFLGNRPWPNGGTVPDFAFRDWRKPRKTPVKIVGVPAEIRIKNLMNKSQEPYR